MISHWSRVQAACSVYLQRYCSVTEYLPVKLGLWLKLTEGFGRWLMDWMTCRDFPALRTVLTEPWKYCLTKVLSRSPGLDCIRCWLWEGRTRDAQAHQAAFISLASAICHVTSWWDEGRPALPGPHQGFYHEEKMELKEFREADLENICEPRLQVPQDWWYWTGSGESCFVCPSEKQNFRRCWQGIH